MTGTLLKQISPGYSPGGTAHTVDKKKRPLINRWTDRMTRDFRQMTVLLRSNTIKLLLRTNQMKLAAMQTELVNAAIPIFLGIYNGISEMKYTNKQKMCVSRSVSPQT